MKPNRRSRGDLPRARRLGGAATVGSLLLLAAAAAVGADGARSDVTIELRPLPATPAQPAPGRGVYGTQLVLDDGAAEVALGLAGAGTRQFLWLNRFANPGGMELEEIQLLFPDTEVTAGDDIQLLVYLDADSDPANGAQLLGSYDVTVQSADGTTFSAYPLAPPLAVAPTGDILIGAVNRYYQTGVDGPSTLPAAVDTTTSQGRSYLALWVGDPPALPDLATASLVDPLSGAAAGNLMIRGFGSPAFGAAIPTVGGVGLALLATLIALAGIALQRIFAGRA